MAGFSFIGSPAFLFVVSEFYDTFAMEANVMMVVAVCVGLLVWRRGISVRWTWASESMGAWSLAYF